MDPRRQEQTAQVEPNIQERARELLARIGSEKPSVFDRSTWTGKIMAWCMQNEAFKTQLFRFVDVLPMLTTRESLERHLAEYFANDPSVPAAFRLGIKSAGALGGLGSTILSHAIRANVESMARQFIIGANVSAAVANLAQLRRQGYAATVDILGEATVSDAEADAYTGRVLDLVDAVAQARSAWPSLGNAPSLDWGSAPVINVSVKPSAMDSQADPMDFEGSVGRILDRLRPVYRKVIAAEGFLCIDMESRRFKNLTLEVFRRLRGDREFRHWPHLGVVIQAYLRDSPRDVAGLLDWAERGGKRPISIRLVKGAYWDYQTVHARQNNWPMPVHTVRAATDAAFERLAETILRHHPWCHLACGSHNVRSVCAVMETARSLGVPEEHYEFQLLYGMAEPFRKALLAMAGRVRLYCPLGELLPGMAYLIRRLLENSSNESFLRQTFAESADVERLLENPEEALKRMAAPPSPQRLGVAPGGEGLPAFRNDPPVDFTQAAARDAFGAALTAVKKDLGRTCPLVIGGRDVPTEDLWNSVNPAQPRQVVGRVCQAGATELNAAVVAARQAFATWRDVPAVARAEYLLKAARIARSRLYELAAWQVFEVGKQWNQACADVTEAIDTLDYYARRMVRLGRPHPTDRVPGEQDELVYEPRGVAAVIAPWNFPLGISCGMSAAAVVTGNCVVYKPSEHSPVCGYLLAELFRQAGLPEGVFNFVPGLREVIGDALVEHPQIAVIAFTGSVAVGLRIIEKAGRTNAEQACVKRVIAEMGGKNAIIVDDDADPDEAIPAIIQSAFGYQGQKCSACSRLIVLEAIYEPLVRRLLEAVRSVRVGPPEEPGNVIGPLISQAAQDKVMRYIGRAGDDGTILYRGQVPPGEGYYVPVTLVGDVRPDSPLAQEEIFGPVLAILRAKDFDQAMALANSTRLALTGAVFSRSPGHLAQARREFRVGNLYLNRGCTGAMVRRQPFGGLGLSGMGFKAGGPDYLLQFLDSRTISENTLRRGFAPSAKR